jgi:predicted transcriptional regulator
MSIQLHDLRRKLIKDALGVTQAKLSKQYGVSGAHVNRVISGKDTNIRIQRGIARRLKKRFPRISYRALWPKDISEFDPSIFDEEKVEK